MPDAPPRPAALQLGRGLFARDTVLSEIHALRADGLGVILRGSPGVGKSSILRHIASDVTTAGGTAIVLSGSELGTSVPLGAFLPLLDAATLGVHRPGGTSAPGTSAPGQSAPSQSGPTPSSAAPLDLLTIADAARRTAKTADLLVVDDAHLLDPASAGLVHQLASAGTAVLLAARRNEPLAAAIDALWRAGGIRPVEIEAFTEEETAALLQSMLSGLVDGGLVRATFEASAGNALYIRELLGAGLDQRVVVRRRGVWVLRAPLPVADNLTALLQERFAGAEDEVKFAAELVAVMDSLRLSWAERVLTSAVWERAEAAGLVRSEGVSQVALRLAHPLYRAAVLGTMTALRRRRVYESLVTAVGADPLSEAERIALGRWSLELNEDRPVGEWLALAQLVQAVNPALAEDFLVAGVAAGGGIPAKLLLANLLTHQHRVVESEAIFAELSADELNLEQRRSLAATRAFLLAMPAQRPLGALALLDEAIAQFGENPELTVVRSTALWRCGRVAEAITAAQIVLAEIDLPIPITAHACLTAVSAMIYAHDQRGVSKLVDRMMELTQHSTDALPEGTGAALLVNASRHAMMLGDLQKAAHLTAQGYLTALQGGDDGVRAQYALLYGWNRALAGDLTLGLRYLKEAHAGHGVWTPTTLPWVRSTLIQILVGCGEVATARRELYWLTTEPFAELYTVDVALARASVLAASGQCDRAIAVLREVCPWAEANGQRLRAEEAWHARMRYGDHDAVEGVIDRYSRQPGAQQGAIVAHAVALRADDPDALERAARSLGEAGLYWYAAEAAAHAVQAQRKRKDGRAELFAIERLTRLVARCPGLNSALIRDQLRSPLTARESELAERAALGHSDAQIAQQLGISVRTVQTHLGRVYGKLGVHGRMELTRALIGEVGNVV